MRRRTITNFSAIPTALFLLLIGVLHSVVNVSGLHRAMVRGEISTRLRVTVVLNAAFSGVAISLLGIIVFLVLPGLRAGSRRAHRVAIAIGISIGVLGLAGYLWVPTQPGVLIFPFFGLLLAIPLLIWRREFSNAL